MGAHIVWVWTRPTVATCLHHLRWQGCDTYRRAQGQSGLQVRVGTEDQPLE